MAKKKSDAFGRPRATVALIAGAAAILAPAASAWAQSRYGNGSMHQGWMGWGGWFPGFGFVPLLVLAAIVIGIVVLVRALRRDDSGAIGRTQPSDRAGDLLDARYARGEIGRDEYLQRKRDLGAKA